jgi:glutaredoxin
MEENNISLQAKDVSAGSDIRRELQSIGGKTQVPCLVIDGQALYESDDIIQWLKDHWGG